MSEPDDHLPISALPKSETALPSIGDSLSEIVQHFSAHGALGLLAIDASEFSGIERCFGGTARLGAMWSLREAVEQLIGDRLGISDLILAGETGRNEIMVLKARGTGIGYPHLKTPPKLLIGTAAALCNPTIGAETQIRDAMEQARTDAVLNEKIGARRRRQKLFELVLEGRIRSVYEPIVEVSTRTVFGYEALARGPEGSEFHSPAALFSSASEEDFIFQLDRLCRTSGLDGARDFPSGAKLFLNIRPTTIYDPNFRSEALRRTLDGCGLTPNDLVLEISEQESISNFDIFREIRDYYGNLGFQMAMDDVGSGYASLESVIELSPEFVKVDRAFVTGIDQDLNRQEMLRALHAVSEKIGARIVGEGLDTLEELEMLGSLGIPFGQGWLFGKPHPLRTDT